MSQLKFKTDNPFEYDPATCLSADQIIDYYIEDFNYSRFIESPMNVFLIGERGSGKTMALRYHSYEVQKRKREIEQKEFDFDKMGVYVSCKAQLFQKREVDLIDDNTFKAKNISEIFLVSSIAYALLSILENLPETEEAQTNSELIEDFEYYLGETLPRKKNFFQSVKLFLDKQNRHLQDMLNNPETGLPNLKAINFYSFIKPLINFTKRFPCLKNVHYLFLIDDVQDLNDTQIELLNSWIAYRDHSEFSFKLSTTKVKKRTLLTSSGGTILEGHDFVTIDMEEPQQNSQSDYGKLARRILDRRLEKCGILVKCDAFFPENSTFKKDIEHYKEILREKAEQEYGSDPDQRKRISDYVYKYARAEYYKNRSAKANLPPYSGLETIIHLSTGVVRNLLYPCFWMYESAINNSTGKLLQIQPAIQTEIIKEKSQALWNFMEREMANSVINCSTEQAKQIFQLFSNLVLMFKERLSQDISEPRAISFTISGYSDLAKQELEPLFRIAREGRLMYIRYGSAKDDGNREAYYTPNRLLLPIHGLDPIGQHARVSLSAKDLIAAAKNNRKINSAVEVKSVKTLFDEEF